MSLSEQELRTLREIEKSLMAEDPKFGASVKQDINFGGRSGTLTLRGVALIVVGLAMMVGGVALAQQSLWFVALSVVGFLVMFGAGVWMLRGSSAAPAEPSGAVHPSRRRVSGASKRGSRGRSTGSKLEENFRRRFEGN
ncbi:membrane protein [Corynebacterium phocae]|uniref:Membrane protein n=1 Tax=Corynebacterium phocae TaxID=161895 RepID=A0A1L7D2A5_9CORY|nr:DUF3040 domain-containing protein [Corynebacterium phocae]APT92220.1 membrane protein [Corynebacterium phocae]KAA8725799.1 DUF3040 domain-containing protein [Corynebacterium phocae]